MVELKARFDERANIRWAKKLEEAGVHVVYGLPGAEEPRQVHPDRPSRGRRRPPLRAYRHRQLQPEDGAPLHGPRPVHGRPRDRRRHGRDVQLPDRLLAAARATARCWWRPFNLHDGILREIDRTIEAHSPDRPARIRMKMNSLLDATSIRALYRASQAGVRVELNVRGICALRPGVAGVSENIEVVSVVGRFLEHSRIYSFERPGEDARIYIGSADLMPRNLYNRVELVTPVEDPKSPRRAARPARPLPRRQHQRLGTRRGWQLDPPPARRQASQRPARVDRAPRGPRRRVALARLEAPRPGGLVRKTARDGAQAHGAGLVARGGRADPSPARRSTTSWRPTSSWSAADTRGCGRLGSSAELEPEARVVLLEADRCGAGPSGRNGGFVNAMWFSLPTLRRALRRRGRAARSHARAGRGRRGSGAGARSRASTPGTAGRLPTGLDGSRARRLVAEVAAACAELGVPDACRPLSEAEVRARCDSPLFRAAAFYPAAATVQPARLALGLRARLLEPGVPVFEGSSGPVRSGRRAGSRRTDRGRVRASAAVLAAGAALAGHRPLRRRLTVDLQPHGHHRAGARRARRDRLDGRRVHHRLAGDGPLLPHHPGRANRLRLGGRPSRAGRPPRRPGRARPQAWPPRSSATCVRFFPRSREGGSSMPGAGRSTSPRPTCPWSAASTGAASTTRSATPGNGVGPSHFAGRTLASLALDRRDEAITAARSSSRRRFVCPPSRFATPAARSSARRCCAASASRRRAGGRVRSPGRSAASPSGSASTSAADPAEFLR